MPFATPAVPRAARSAVASGLIALAAVLCLPGSAQAGRLLVTGHDADTHCAREGVSVGGCRFFSTAVGYVVGGAPDPGKPILVLDRGPLDVPAALRKAFPGGVPAHQVVDPRSPEFAAVPLNTATYSAIVVASSKDDPTDPTPSGLNEVGSTPDTDAINARAADIEAFFDAGGGLLVNSGGAAGRANSAAYYRFIRITRAGRAVRQPLALTAIGRAIGFQDARQFPGESNDINCCETHMTFELPAPESPLKVTEVDRDGRAVTLVAETNRLATVEEPVASPAAVFSGVAGSTTAALTGGSTTGNPTTRPRSACIPKRGRLRVSLRRPRGVRFASVTVYVNGKRKRRVTARRLGTRSRTRAFTVTLSQTRRSRVLVVAQTASGRKLTFRQTYRPC